MGAALSGFTAESAAALSGPHWLRAERRAAFKRFYSSELPTEALEQWRYSRVEQLDLDRYAPALGLQAAEVRAHPADEITDQLLPVLKQQAGVTVVETLDGFVSELSVSPGSSLEIADLSGGGDRPEYEPIGEDPDAFVTLNRAFAGSWIDVRVPKRSAAETVVVLHRVGSGGVAAFPRVTVGVGEAAELTVVEVFAGGSGSLVVPVAELSIGDAARLSYLNVQALDPGAWQMGFQASRVAKDASLVSAAAALGGGYARLRTDSVLAGTGASGRLLALYFASGDQMHDFRTVQHHSAPKTQSELLYKGVVANAARSVYSGLIRVDKGARGTNAMQTNRNLVLHEGAHADSVPNLEIEDNDVRCSHASAVGPIAEDQRFYLESRGVPTKVADRLIALGFLDDVLEQLPVQGVAAPLRAALDQKLVEAEVLEQSSLSAGTGS